MNESISLGSVTRVLAEIASTLESVDQIDARLERVLILLADIVPNRRCGLLAKLERGEHVTVVPQSDVPEHDAVASELRQLFALVGSERPMSEPRSDRNVLALPITGLDTTLGLIRVEPGPRELGTTDLQILSVIAAQIGGFLVNVQLRERERERTAELVATHEAQQLIAGVVSHDLATPLAVITTAAEYMLIQATDPSLISPLQRTLRNARRAARLVSDLSDVTEARVRGKLNIAPRRVEVVRLLHSVVEDLRSAHPTSTIDFSAPISPRLEAMWDTERVAQLITNLVVNAVAHGVADRPIAVSATEDRDAVYVRVHNDGQPIQEETIPALFDPFHRSSLRERTGGARGLGLGLYIVDQIARAHGGSVGVHSTDAEGTTFTARLPR